MSETENLIDTPNSRKACCPLGTIGAMALIIAAGCLGFAIGPNAFNSASLLHVGEYTPFSMFLVTIALIGSVVGVFVAGRGVEQRQSRWIEWTLAAIIAGQFIALLIIWPVGVDQSVTGRPSHFIYLYLTSASILLVFFGFTGAKSVACVWFPALLIVHSILGFWMVRSSPVPHIDVWEFQYEAPKALLDGRNPYDADQVQFPDIYDSTLPGHQRVYGEGMVESGRLRFGFPYPPLSLYCSTLGVKFGNDTRYAQAIALTLAGLLIGYSRPGRLPKLAAALLMFTPAEWFVLGRAWTEPFVILFLAATVFCAARRWRWALPIALGLLLASKQYLMLALPLSFLLLPEFQWRSKASWRSWILLLLGAGATAAAVTLPLALRDRHAFWFSTATVQKDAPFRWDALSYLVTLSLHDSKYTRYVWLPFVVLIPAMVLAMWKARRSPAGFAAAMALVYLVFISFNKQAFCNYYFFVIGCLCCAIGIIGPHPHRPSSPTTET